jgi:GNAT superfamily N-acetyltransferase
VSDPAKPRLSVRALREDEREWLDAHLRESWGSPVIVSRGRKRNAALLDAIVCLNGARWVGVATFELNGGDLELVTLDALERGIGAGSALLEAVATIARRRGCARVWLVTTNDNLDALRFYQRRGMRLVAVWPGAIDAARELKPEIAALGEHGIPIRDEIELELNLGPT